MNGFALKILKKKYWKLTPRITIYIVYFIEKTSEFSYKHKNKIFSIVL